jgi:pimeloyl-ACP methyl ester carboxylesterase
MAVIHGSGSDVLSAATIAEMRRRRPDMICAEIPDRGHIPFLDEPAAIGAISDWLGLLRGRCSAIPVAAP